MKTQLDKFLAALKATGLDQRCIDQATKRVPELVSEFEARSENRSGGVVIDSVRKEVLRTLGHLTTASKNVGDDSPSRRNARKLIRFASCCEDFTELVIRATKFRGDHNRLMRQIKEKQERELEREIFIDDTYTVLEIRTITHLKSVGKILQNCLSGKGGSCYRDELREGETEFWVIRHLWKEVGVLSIATDTREIGECNGMNSEPLELDPVTMNTIERAVNGLPVIQESPENDEETTELPLPGMGHFIESLGIGSSDPLESLDAAGSVLFESFEAAGTELSDAIETTGTELFESLEASGTELSDAIEKAGTEMFESLEASVDEFAELFSNALDSIEEYFAIK